MISIEELTIGLYLKNGRCNDLTYSPFETRRCCIDLVTGQSEWLILILHVSDASKQFQLVCHLSSRYQIQTRCESFNPASQRIVPSSRWFPETEYLDRKLI